VAQTCNASTQEQEDRYLQASLGYIAKACLEKQTKKHDLRISNRQDCLILKVSQNSHMLFCTELCTPIDKR
jgi:hypothetical protein